MDPVPREPLVCPVRFQIEVLPGRQAFRVTRLDAPIGWDEHVIFSYTTTNDKEEEERKRN